jgi:hypothetical protein
MRLRSNAFTLLDYFQKIFRRNNTENEKFLIIIDQLDENWTDAEIKEYKKILISLIHVAQDINKVFRENSAKIVIFLRTDIYAALEFNDWNKIIQDSAIQIVWNATTLDEMFTHRIKKYKPHDLNLNIAEGTNSIFSTKRVRHRASPLDYILRRTFLRPRDLIVYMNKINEIHDAKKSELYTKDDIYNADASFSDNLYNELMDEWKTQHSNIEDYLNVLQNIGFQTFTYKEYSDKYIAKFPSADKAQIDSTLKFLFYNSIIGQKRSVYWEYHCVNPNIAIKFEREFHVNSGLKRRLTLIESRTMT